MKSELIIYSVFWLLYAPIEIVIWIRRNAGYSEIIISTLIGLLFIYGYLITKPQFVRKKTCIKTEEEARNELPPHWTNVFEENFGVKIIDLD